MRNKRHHVCSILLILALLAGGLTGCGTKPHLAPVVNAWYQSSATHNGYRVRRGDTIYSIAWAFGLDYRALAAANHLHSPYEISIGQRLKMISTPRGRAFIAPHKPAKTSVVVKKSTKIKSRSHVVNYRPLKWRWPAKGRLVERFKRGKLGHQGISISGKFGQSVRASAAGEVVYSGDGVRGYGNLIIVKHNNHYLSAYAFNQRNLVKVGDVVRTGSVIARMGRNDAGKVLLYFEIRRNGVPVNPLKFLQ